MCCCACAAEGLPWGVSPHLGVKLRSNISSHRGIIAHGAVGDGTARRVVLVGAANGPHSLPDGDGTVREDNLARSPDGESDTPLLQRPKGRIWEQLYQLPGKLHALRSSVIEQP